MIKFTLAFICVLFYSNLSSQIGFEFKMDRPEVDDVFDKVDALIAPVAPTPPFKLGEKTKDPLEMYSKPYPNELFLMCMEDLAKS